jgi:hypothetical protein
MDLGGASTPRDGLVQTVHLSTYDPKVGKFSGLQVSANLPSGTSFYSRSLHVTLDDPLLQWTTRVPAQLGTEYRYLIVSGTDAGPLVRDKTFYSTSYQLSRKSSNLSTLASASAGSLQALGVSRDSIDRLVGIAEMIGLPISGAGIPSERVTTSGSAIARLDLTPTAARPGNTSGSVLYFLAAAGFSSAEGFGGGPTSFPARMSHSTHRDAQLLFDYAPYFWSALSETKTSFSMQDDRTQPYAALPSALLLLNSTLIGGTGGFAPLQIGGNGGAASNHSSWRWQSTNETSWMTFDGGHKFQAYADVTLYHFDISKATNRLGTFTYNSLGDLAAGQPSTFARTLSERAGGADAWQAVLALSDIWYVSQRARTPFPRDGNGLTFQYGVRVDLARFAERPAYNPQVDALFRRRTDQMPDEASVEPMLGFTWNQGTLVTRTGPAVFTETRSAISGGIREYRGILMPESIDDVAQQSGLPGAIQQLECVGSAIPVPNWNSYRRSEAAVPTQCAGSAGSPYVQAAAPVTLYAPGYLPTTSWRGELNWRWTMSGQLTGNIGTTYAINLGQGGTYDLNFNPIPRLTLFSEATRPIYVTSASIVPATGAVASGESRRFQSYSHVTELRSDLRSEQRQATAGLTYRYGTTAFLSPASSTPPRFNATLRAWYTFADSRDQTRGFSATTAGDPRDAAWAPGVGPRHTVQMSVNFQLDRWFSITFAGRIASGYRYTPRVGSDINGDGFINDRAFVFDPSLSQTTAQVTGMASLLNSAPIEARRCLRAQLSRIAVQNGCDGPWNALLGVVAITIDPFRIGLGNKGSMTIYVNNALGGLDQLLHGESRLQGWGQVALPDPVLLNVRGFDQNGSRFIYTVNPQFGSTSAARNTYRPPFRVTLDFRMDIGRDRETQAIESFMRSAQTNGAAENAEDLKNQLTRTATFFGSDVQVVLRLADSLHLTRQQVDTISAISRRNIAIKDSIYLDLARYLISQRLNYGGVDVRHQWHESIAAAIRITYSTGQRVRMSLTDEQFMWLRARRITSSLEYSPDWLERNLRGAQLLPR